MKLFVSVFEPSADVITSLLIKSLRTLQKDLQILGFGGENLQKLGLVPLSGKNQIGRIIGFEDAVSSIKKHWDYLQHLKKIEFGHPDFALLVDYPGFNIVLASQLKKLGIPVIYYILPQVWAWGSVRTKFLHKYVDLAVGIYPFEPDFFAKYHTKVYYFGHPLIDSHRLPKKAPAVSQRKVVGFFPGSRPSEIISLMPVLRKIAKILRGYGLSKFLLSRVPSVPDKTFGDTSIFDVRVEPPSEWYSEIDVAVAASGTITLELALAGIPTVVLYRVKPLTYLISKLITHVPFISIPNLILGEEVFPEFIQDIPVEEVAKTIVAWLDTPSIYQRVHHNLLKLEDMLGPPGVIERTAKFIHNWIQYIMLYNGTQENKIFKSSSIWR